ncbi:response regulator transcription factor [Bradyrhizobium lablabi]|uniref:response regulator transcription factor n=1 Tax=Bradyrhizobium lablabi TaxID=722472 RepID=UPI001BAB0681|nr:response regulator transcription factor [Bradyrhizobium lablabi]MBR1125004.1 response regulator transcription factor [Bradyrhizobium lablabi]
MSCEPAVPTYILEKGGLFREGLRLILSNTRFSPQGCATELNNLADVPCDRPALFIVGLGENEETICSRIRDQYPLAVVVAVADESNPELLANALDDGASAALFSSVSPDAFLNTLRAVINEGLVLIDARLWSLEIQPKAEERLAPSLPNEILLMPASEPQGGRQLSSREVAILERIVRGDSNKHVARFFNIAEPTVKAHVKAILRKIGASNRTQAAMWAVNQGLFENQYGASSLPLLVDNNTDR